MIDHEVSWFTLTNHDRWWWLLKQLWCIMNYYDVSWTPMGKSVRISWTIMIDHDLHHYTLERYTSARFRMSWLTMTYHLPIQRGLKLVALPWIVSDKPRMLNILSRVCRMPPLQGLLFSVAWGHAKSLNKWSSHNANEASNLSDLTTIYTLSPRSQFAAIL